MKLTLLIPLFIFTSITFFAQDRYFDTVFPDDWTGLYKGMMYLANSENGLTDSVPVSLLIEETEDANTWTYKMEYDSPKWGVMTKDYQLKRNDTLPKNHLLMDELDGILIHEVLMGNTMYSNFEVAEAQISTVMRLNEYGIDFELISSRSQGQYKSETEMDPESGAVFEVISNPPLATQFVRLYKQD